MLIAQLVDALLSIQALVKLIRGVTFQHLQNYRFPVAFSIQLKSIITTVKVNRTEPNQKEKNVIHNKSYSISYRILR